MSMQPPTDADEPLDREERELAALYRELPRAEPDAALDARILAQAEDAVVRKPWRYRRLLVGFGSFSAVAMAAGLTWHLMANGNGTRPAPPVPAAPVVQAAKRTLSADGVVHFRIIADKKDKQANAALERQAPAAKAGYRAAATPELARPAPPPPAPAPPPPHETTLVVPVRILPDQQQKPSVGSASGGQTVSPATVSTAQTNRHFGMMSPSLSRTVARTGSRPEASPGILVERARKALSQNDMTRARQLVSDLQRDYPDYPLPSDLSSLKPASDESGTP